MSASGDKLNTQKKTRTVGSVKTKSKISESVDEGTVVKVVKEGVEKDSEVSNCGFCNEEIGESDLAVQCELCSLWFHIRCQQVPKEIYEYLGEVGIHWYCKNCNSKFAALMRSVIKLENRQDALEKDVQQNKAEITKVKEEILQKITRNEEEMKQSQFLLGTEMQEQRKGIESNRKDILEYIEKNNTNNLIRLDELNTKVNDIIENNNKVEHRVSSIEMGNTTNTNVPNINNTNNSVLSRRDVIEQIEIDKRKCNLVIAGIGEEDNEKEVTHKIIHFLLGEEEGQDIIKHIERVGKRVPDKNRLVKITLQNTRLKTKLLKNGLKLKGTDLKNYYISPDLTPSQQLEDKRLRDKVKELKEQGMDNIKISKGKIVKNVNGLEETLFPPVPQN